MKVLKSWGAAGQLVLSLSSDDPGDLKAEEPVFIEFDGLPVPFFFESVEPKGSRLIVKFEDVDTLAEAEELVGRELFFRSEGGDEQDSITGMRICDSRTRRILGEVVDFSDYSGNMVVTVETSDGEILLPLHEDLIVSIHGDVITLDVPDGLF